MSATAADFNDENAPQRFLPPIAFPYGEAHESEVQYLFGVSNATYLAADHEALSLVLAQAVVQTDFRSEHQCAF